MDTISEVGKNLVSINDTLIPALNIQVDGYPKVEERLDLWFGIYFEIMFEDGDLWVVDQGSTPGHPLEHQVFVEEIKNYDLHGNGHCADGSGSVDRKTCPDGTLMAFSDWDEFLKHYDYKRFPYRRNNGRR